MVTAPLAHASMDVDAGTGMKRSLEQDEDDFKRSRVSTAHAVTEVVTKKGKLAASLNEDPEELRLLFDVHVDSRMSGAH